MLFKRIGREWLVLVFTLTGAAFSVGDGAGWIKYLSGYEPTQPQVIGVVFVLFAAVIIARLVKLQTKIDDMRGGVIFTAIPSPLNINSPGADDPPLKDDEFYIRTTIHFEIWTDIDINTRSLALIIVGSRNPPWWKIWKLRQRKRLLGIGIHGQNSAIYRRQIKSSDPQPFKDEVTFSWRGKRRLVDWGDSFLLELALWGGIPKTTWRTEIDPSFYKNRPTNVL